MLLHAPLAPSRNVVRTQVLPRLLRLLDEEHSDDIVSSALVAIGRLADPGELQSTSSHKAIRAQLRASNLKVRESAVLGLGLLGTPEAAADLLAVLTNEERGRPLVGKQSISARTRAFAAHALGLAAQRIDSLQERQRIAFALVDVLERGNFGRDDLSVAAVGALGLVDLGRRTIVPVPELREHAQLDRVVSARSLTQYLETWTIRPRSSHQGRTRSARAHACVAFARAAATASEDVRLRAVEHLVEVSTNRREHVHVRTAATIALGEVARAGSAEPDRDARRQLLELAKSGQPLERRFARIAVASVCGRPGDGDDPMAGWDEVRKVLTAALGRSRSSDLAWTALALGILEDAAHDADIETGSSATSALSMMALRRKSDDDSAALGLGLALAARGTDRAAQVGERLVDELDETTTPVMRGHLSVALGLIGHGGASAQMRHDLVRAKNQPILLWSTAVGLGLLGEPVGPELVEALENSTSSQHRIAITAALGQTGTASAVFPLLDLLGETRRPTRLRASAVDALGAICDLERLPWRDPIAHAMPYFASTPTLNGSGSGILERPW
ncbi:MAG: HEAT repeat domain-containing protein [Planctomycetota bacterium]